MGSWFELLLGNLWVDDLIGFGTTPPFPHWRFHKEYVVFLFAEVRFLWSRHNTSTAAMNSLPNNWRSHRVRSYARAPSDFRFR